ncbi:DNA-3-methyladenine glycosylase I [Virgibacillus sp. W0181]|uniref:DNA-3-methyladenine glycosylase I n=1 Tax=Virgibacillus sp. W0181 TaxID=3391581 RepID=UPI003F4533AE
MALKNRCAWVTDDTIYIQYHDEEWGIVSSLSFNDCYLFEMLSLEGAQAGLSWITILKRREAYRNAFDQFDPEVVSNYPAEKVEQLLENEEIIRNKQKILSVITNAKAFLGIQQEYGSFSEYIWAFVDGEPIINHWETFSQVPASTKLSEQISKDLKKKGFKFVGPIICYSFMQAIGMVNDHTKDCFLYQEKDKD